MAARRGASHDTPYLSLMDGGSGAPDGEASGFETGQEAQLADAMESALAQP